VAALGVQSEYDCGRQTVRPISRARYRDRLGVDRDSLIQIEGGTASPIAPGTVSAQVFNLLCGGRPSSGSGVVVASDRVLTNHHVVAACAQVQVVQEGRRVGARVIAQDPRHDLALLEALTVAPKGRGALALRRSPVTGESVMVAGFPLAGLLGQDIVVTTGIVNAQSGVRNDQTQMQISAPVQPGNSGGPLLDKSGRLVGLVVSKLNALRTAATTGDIAQNVNFAIKPEIVRAFAQTHGVAMGAVDAGERMETEDLAVRARDVTVKIECTGARPGGTAGASPGAV
jgi:S1-C subfamily serine protease